MARRELTFICQDRGATYGRWQGKCEAAHAPDRRFHRVYKGE